MISGCQQTAIKSTKKGISFGDVSVSVFTTTTEDTSKSPTLTNILPVDSGVQTNPIKDSRNNVEDSPKSVSVSMPINRSLEDEYLDKGGEKCQRQQRVEQRQEKAKKKAATEMKKLELEFERKRRDHDEQMRQLEEKLQIKMLEAELETSSGEQYDGSKSSTKSESEVEKRSTAARSLKSHEWEDYAENMRVSLPRQDLFSTAKTRTRKTYVQLLEDYQKQCSFDEDYENPFGYDRKVESTSIRGFRDFNRHDNSRNLVFSQISSSCKSPTFSIAPTASSQRSLPKLKLREFDGNTLDWPEWSGMFLATVDSSNISKDEKMKHLKILLVGKVKRAVNGMGYAGAMYDHAWNSLQRKFGQPHHIVSSQLAKKQNFSQIRFNDVALLVDFAETV